VSRWTQASTRLWHGGFGDPEPTGPIAFAARRLIDGSGGPPVENAVLRTDGSTITWCGPAAADPERGSGPIVDLGDRTLMPGLIDCHAHPGFHPQPVETGPERAWTSERRVLEGAGAAWRALASGVTTMRVTGGQGVTSFALRAALDRGVARGPRLLIAGRVICPTGGHGHSGGEEADGPVEVRRAARVMFKNGADFLKLTATGGGTARTVRSRGTFTVEELTAAAQEADQHNTYATAHVHGLEGIVRCLDAGIQMLEHATFVGDDGLEHFDRALAERIRDQNVPVVPTVQVNGRVAESDDLPDFLKKQDAAEQKVWERRLESFKRRVELVAQLHDVGVVVLMGSDGGGRPAAIDDLAYGLELHVRAGVPAMDVIVSTTSLAAHWIGLGAVTGTLAPGKSADVIGMPGDPLSDITAVARTDLVLAQGTLVRAPEGVALPSAQA
jgi:imidazolonepropionase-like amidohydrolase